MSIADASQSGVSEQRRREVIDALRRGTVPSHGLDALAVGLDRFEDAVDEALEQAAVGEAVFKAVRGEYGAGKTFFTRWLAQRGRTRGFASTEIQISENETPLHRLETVYRRLTEHLTTSEFTPAHCGRWSTPGSTRSSRTCSPSSPKTRGLSEADLAAGWRS